MKKKIITVSIAVLVITLFTINGTVLYNQAAVSNETNDNVNQLNHKTSSVTQSLGWEVGDTGTHQAPYLGYVSVTCQGISDDGDVIVLVDSAYTGSFPENDMQTYANKFQRDVYDPLSDFMGVPTLSTIDESNGVAIFISDFSEYNVAGVYTHGNFGTNGYESISIDKGSFPAWSTVTHEYQHCIHNNYRRGESEERWFNEGMSETIPAMLGVRSNNRSRHLAQYEGTDPIYDGAGTNIPLLYWDYDDILGMVIENYGGAFAFTWYVYEQYGPDLLGEVMRDANKSVFEAYNDAFENHGYDFGFDKVFKDFALAMRLDDLSLNDGLWGYVGIETNPDFGLWGNNAPRVSSAADFPVAMEAEVYHRGIDAKNMNFGSSSDISALQIEFEGSATTNFTVWGVMSVYINSSYSENIVTELSVDQDTQMGTNIVLVPSGTTTFQLITVNMQGTEGKFISDSWPADLSDIRDNYTATITTIDPGLEASFTSNFVTEEDVRAIDIEADISWDLDQDITTSGIKPMVTLWDKDGEFAFNVQIELTYDSASGKWVGTMELPEDIKSGNYMLKLTVQGVELSTDTVSVGGASAPGFAIPSVLLATTIILLHRRKKQYK